MRRNRENVNDKEDEEPKGKGCKVQQQTRTMEQHIYKMIKEHQQNNKITTKH